MSTANKPWTKEDFDKLEEALQKVRDYERSAVESASKQGPTSSWKKD